MNPKPTHLPAGFAAPIAVVPLADGVTWRLIQPLRFCNALDRWYLVPRGFETDFASIPPLARIALLPLALALALTRFGLVGDAIALPIFLAACVVIWCAESLENDNRLDAPAALHDYGYRVWRGDWPLKFHWDWLLFVAMRSNKVPMWKAWLIWFNVALFGWFAWWQDGRKALGAGREESSSSSSSSSSSRPTPRASCLFFPVLGDAIAKEVNWMLVAELVIAIAAVWALVRSFKNYPTKIQPQPLAVQITEKLHERFAAKDDLEKLSSHNTERHAQIFKVIERVEKELRVELIRQSEKTNEQLLFIREQLAAINRELQIRAQPPSPNAHRAII